MSPAKKKTTKENSKTATPKRRKRPRKAAPRGNGESGDLKETALVGIQEVATDIHTVANKGNLPLLSVTVSQAIHTDFDLINPSVNSLAPAKCN